MARLDDKFQFSEEQWRGVVLAGSITAVFSLVANLCVIIVHFGLTWYRPYVVNRLSLRMIVVACVLNSIFCIAQLFTDDISSLALSCRAFAFLLTASDTMACMCLAMIGLNLVTIFVLKIPRSVALEVVYYVIVALMGVVVTIIPAFAGSAKGPVNSSSRELNETCWYHYYFDGRINNIFNWMWYYGCLMFALLFAAVCAAVSIRYVTKKQKNFTGALNIFTRRKRDIHTMTMLRKYTKNNTDIFQKIARRCICYPLVPFVTKSWGVGIEIAAAVKKPVPYQIYVADRVFSCLFGFLVGCIYFTDPAINAAFTELVDNIKSKYVHDYFNVEYKPGDDTDITRKDVQHLESVEIAPLSNHIDNYIPPQISELADIPQETNEAEDIDKEHRKSSGGASNAPYTNTQLYNCHQSAYPFVPTLQIQSKDIPGPSEQNRRYSVIRFKSTDVVTVSPNQTHDKNHGRKRLPSFFKKSSITIIPMRRLSNTPTAASDGHFDAHSRMSRNTQKLVPFRCPMYARFMHWVLVRIFRVKPVDDSSTNDPEKPSSQQRAEATTFHGNFTEQQPQTRDSQPDPVSNENLKRSSYIAYLDEASTAKNAPLEKRIVFTDKLDVRHNNSSQPNIENSSIQETNKKPRIPLRRASSINVATLQRQRLKKEFAPSNPSPVRTLPGNASFISTNTSKSRSVFSKILGRRLSSNLNKFTKGKKSRHMSLAMSESNLAQKQQQGMDSSLKSSLSESSFTSQSEEQKESEASKKPQSDIDTVDLGLIVYPSGLSPRPLSQYTNQSLKLTQKRESVDTSSYYSGQRCITNRNSIISVRSMASGQSYNLSELFYGSAPTEMENLDDLQGQSSHGSSSVSLSQPIEYSRPLDLQDHLDGFRFGSTTIHSISNWQGDTAEERLSEFTESWDIAEQLRKQIDFSNKIKHL